MFKNLKKYSFLNFSMLIAFVIISCSNNNDDSGNNPMLQKDIDFVKTLGGSKNESARSIINTSDGGYAILGYTQSADGDILNKSNESFDYWLLKYDQNNTLQWQRTYGGSDDDRGNCIIQTSDGGFAFLGSSKSNDGDVSVNNGFEDFWLVKTNASGSITWEKSFGFSGADNGTSMIQTNDNGFLITGVLDVTASGGQGNTKTTSKRHAGGDYWAIKLNASGVLEWSKFFGGTFTDTPYGVVSNQ